MLSFGITFAPALLKTLPAHTIHNIMNFRHYQLYRIIKTRIILHLCASSLNLHPHISTNRS